MNKIIHAFLTASLFLFMACSSSSSKNTEKITVASEQADCVGVAPQKCLLVKEDGSDEWTFLYSQIEGFHYEPGYEYRLEIEKKVRENPAQDQSSIRYILVKQLSKIRKNSENLP